MTFGKYAGVIARFPSLVVLALIRIYQRTLSPALPIITMGSCACRFAPTCSHYAAEAVRVHGALRGSWLALRRLVKCTPLHPGGFDPVPARVPVARRVAARRRLGGGGSGGTVHRVGGTPALRSPAFAKPSADSRAGLQLSRISF